MRVCVRVATEAANEIAAMDDEASQPHSPCPLVQSSHSRIQDVPEAILRERVFALLCVLDQA